MLVYDREIYTSEGLESGKKRWVYDGQVPLPDLTTVKHTRKEYSIKLKEFEGRKQECIVTEENGNRYRYIVSTGVDESEARVKPDHIYFKADYYYWGPLSGEEVRMSTLCESADQIQVGDIVRIEQTAHWNHDEKFFRTAVCTEIVDPEFKKKSRYYPTEKAWKSKFQDSGIPRWDSNGVKYQEKRNIGKNKSSRKKDFL